MAAHSSTLAWKIPLMEEPGRLQSMRSLRVGHNRATSLSLFTFMHWRRKWQPTPVFLPGESQGWGSLVGCRLWGRTELDTTEATQQQQYLWELIPKKQQGSKEVSQGRETMNKVDKHTINQASSISNEHVYIIINKLVEWWHFENQTFQGQKQPSRKNMCTNFEICIIFMGITMTLCYI